jgi:hypothetical protein
MPTYVRINQVEDETQYFNSGNEAQQSYFSFEKGESGLQLSYQDTFPTDYKIAGFTVFRDLNLYITSRETYDIFNFCGDLGGLNEVLLLLGTIITGYWAKAATYRFAWHSLYYKRQNE